MLLLARLGALVADDDELCRFVLPLLTDTLAGQTTGADAEVGGGAARARSASPETACMAALWRYGLTEFPPPASHPLSPPPRTRPCSAQAYAVAAHALASVALVCSTEGRRWGYDLVVDLLLKLYKFPQFRWGGGRVGRQAGG